MRIDLPLAAQRALVLVREGLKLLRRHAAERQLDADHLDIGLALPVDSLLEAELDERVLGRVAGEELLGLVVEVVEFPLDDRDDVAGDRPVDLRVAEGPLARAARLHRAKVANPTLIRAISGRARDRRLPAA